MVQQKSEKLALVLTGGGARGAYQVGVLKYVSEIVPDPKFKILLGSSAGAINVSALASQRGSFQAAVHEMELVWKHLTIDQVMKIGILSLGRKVLLWIVNLTFGGIWGRPLTNSLIDTTPLKQLIHDIYRPDIVAEKIERGDIEAIAVTATEIATASSVTFVQAKEHKQWMRAKRRSEPAKITAEHVLASAAIPFFFKAVRIGLRQYVDGSVRSSTPLSPAARLGATKIFSIGVRKSTSASDIFREQGDVVEDEPSASDIAGLVLNSLFSDAVDADAEHLQRINQLVKDSGEDLAAKSVAMRPIEVFLARPSEDIGKVAKEFLSSVPWVLRYLLRGLGGEKSKSSDVVSYMMFDGKYAARLIDMGYKDALNQSAQIKAFFNI